MPRVSLLWLVPSLTLILSAPAAIPPGSHTTASPPAVSSGPHGAGEAEVFTLEFGTSVERPLAGGNVHFYSLDAAPGQLLRALVEPKGIDVAVSLLSPSGEEVGRGDTRPQLNSSEPTVLEAVIHSAGTHRLMVSSRHDGVAAGSYEFSVESPRPATSRDRVRLAAQGLLAEGNRLPAEEAKVPWGTVREKYKAALGLFRELGDRRGEAQALAAVAYALSSTAEHRLAVNYCEQALAVFRELGDRRGEARTLLTLGWSSNWSGDVGRALDSYNTALALFRVDADRRGEALALQSLGRFYGWAHDTRQALGHGERALELFRGLGDRRGEANTLMFVGTFHGREGETQMMLEHYARALELFRAIGDFYKQWLTLARIADVYADLGDARSAHDYHLRSIEPAQAMGSLEGEASVFASVGDIYNSSGEGPKALAAYHRALGLYRASGLTTPVEAELMITTGRAHLAAGERRKARDLFNRALVSFRRGVPRWREKGDNWEAKALQRMGKIHELLGQPGRALAHYRQALALYRARGRRELESSVLADIAALYSSLGEGAAALAHHRQALLVRRAIKDQNGAAETLYLIARLVRDGGDPEAARAHIEEALSFVESLRSRLASRHLRSSYFSTVQKYYEFYVDLLMRLDKARPAEGFAATALEAAERARARTLLEALAESRTDLRAGAPAVLLRRERQLRQQLNALAERQTRLLTGEHTETQAAAVAEEIKTLTAGYQDVEARMRDASPSYAALTRPPSLTLRQIQEEVLDHETVLLEYALGEERSYLWAVSADTFQSFELPRRAAIEEAVRRIYALLSDGEGWATRGGAGEQFAAAAGRLSRMLLPPAVASLTGTRRLVVVADGALQYIPFGALPSPRQAARPRRPGETRPLIADHEVVSLPSASVISVLRREAAGRERASKNVAVLADPVFSEDDERVAGTAARGAGALRESVPLKSARSAAGEVPGDDPRLAPRLPFSRREAEAILGLAPGGDNLKLLDFEASKSAAVSAELSRYRILHFATHGFLDSEHPEFSGVVLSLVNRDGGPVDGFLRLNEIYGMKLSADLVVLSGCRTGLGREMRGEGLISLTRGFMYAGAPRVVASLWRVDDAATAELMRRFYEGMLRGRMRPAEALRAAKVAMWAQPRWRSPFFWAAFELQGEWR